MSRIHLSFSFCLLFLLVMAVKFTQAQTSRQDAVYLRNGSIIRGKVLENVVGKYTRIEIVGPNALVIPESEVERLVLDEPVPAKECSDPKQYDYTALADVGFMGGEKNTMSLTLALSWL